MKVTFVTVCYRTPGLIRQLLRGFAFARPSFAHEYILVDNAPGDGTGAMVREQFPWVRIIESPRNVGFGSGHNLAFREAKGEYIMMLNPDLTVFPSEIEKLVTFADTHPDRGLFGPRVVNPDRTIQRSFYRFPSLLMPLYRRTLMGRTSVGQRALAHYFMHDADVNAVQDVDGLFGAAMLIRRAALDAIGGFDERFFMYFEDIDLCRRAWETGWGVCYAPVATFVHYLQRESDIKHPWQIMTNRLVREHLKSAAVYHWKYRRKPHPRMKSNGVS